ncbi:MAG: sigma-70 family RNA polymerase sigma factor [Labilithrix sp.]|nr:sigma-70 family RNA polymerase sigma factor [Labilithrix sp.]MBX3221953.1 sigma-70 family RNA polymerase sigma factor [Labilithrix sp.]
MAPLASDAYARHGRALLRKAERMLQSRADAQDVVHALFADLLQRAPGDVDHADPFELPYLYRAITNRCLTLLRDEKNRARILEGHDDALRGPVRTRCDERTIDMDLLLKLTRTLDEPTLEVVVCRFFDDMTQEEIAGFLGISRKTVGRKLDDVREAVARLSAAPSDGPARETEGGRRP